MRKRQLYKRAMIMSLAAAMTAGSATTAFAGQWQQDTKGWRFQTGVNAYHTNGWQWLDGNGDGISECYYFGSDGYMAAATTTPDGYTVNADGAWTENGVVKTRDDRIAVPNGTWICSEGANAGRWWWKNSDGSYPKSEWKWLDGNNDGIAECYYFDADGWCVLNGTTPDGFTVNADGAWMVGGTAVKRPAKHGSAGGRVVALVQAPQARVPVAAEAAVPHMAVAVVHPLEEVHLPEAAPPAVIQAAAVPVVLHLDQTRAPAMSMMKIMEILAR